MSSPLVDVVAVCYNHRNYLLETLNSIISQTYTNIKLHVFDDASTDDSVAEIERWIRSNRIEVKLVAHKKNLGLCATLNEAIEYCSGEYIQFIACDDVLYPEKIAVQVTELENDLGAAVCCSNFSSIDSDGNIVQHRYFPESYRFPDDPFVAILEGHQGLPIVIHSPTALVRRKAIQDVGGYRNDLAQEDFYMWLKLSRDWPILFVNKVLVLYRVLDNSLSNTLLTKKRKKYLEQHIEVIEELLASSSSYQKELYSALFSRKKKLIECQLAIGEKEDGEKILSKFSLEVESYDMDVAVKYIPKLLLTYWKNDVSFNKYLYFRYLIRLNIKYLAPMVLSLSYKNHRSHKND